MTARRLPHLDPLQRIIVVALLATLAAATARADKPPARLTPVENMTLRKPGAWRDLKIRNDALFEPMDPEDLDVAEGKHTDEFGITLPRSSEP